MVKVFDHDKQSATGALKTTSKIVIQKTAEATFDLIGNDLTGNKINDKITKTSKTSKQNNSETATNRYNKEYLKKNISLQKKDKKLLMD